MSNVYRFPNKKPIFQNARINIASRLPNAAAKAASRRLWGFIRPVLFILLCWLRWPIVGVFRLISGPALLFCFVGYFLLPAAHKWEILSFSAGLSLASFVLGFLFDSLLVKLSPDNFYFER